MAEPTDNADKALSALSLQELKDKLQVLEDKMKVKKNNIVNLFWNTIRPGQKRTRNSEEKERARHRKKYEANKESSIKRLAVWRVENLERVKEYNRIHAPKLKERLAADPEFRKEHLEKSRIAREKFKAKRKAELEEIKRKIAEATNANSNTTKTNDI